MENFENERQEFGKEKPVIIIDTISAQNTDYFKELKKRQKQNLLNLSLIGLFLSLFFIGGFICVLTLVLSIINLRKEKSTLSKWTIVISICAIIISGVMLFAGYYFDFFKNFKLAEETKSTLSNLV